MIYVLSGVGGSIALGVLYVLYLTYVRLGEYLLAKEELDTRPQPVYVNEEYEAAIRRAEGRLDQLETGAQELRIAVAHGIQEAERRENRIKATVASAQRKLRESGVESPGVEAEAIELFGGNADPGNEGGVPAVYETVAGGATSSVPGVTAEQLRSVRGF